METPRIFVFQYQQGAVSCDLNWLGGKATGVELVLHLLQVAKLENISVCAWVTGGQRAVIGLTAEEATKEILGHIADHKARAA
jgi:hypothetical protein